MKWPLQFVVLLFLAGINCASSGKESAIPEKINNATIQNTSKMKIKIGNSTFKATLHDNATVSAFKTLLPLTINMVELNGNEKYAELSRGLPSDAFTPRHYTGWRFDAVRLIYAGGLLQNIFHSLQLYKTWTN